MRPKTIRAALEAILDGRLRVEGDALPPALYPDGWVPRAEALESGDARPRDWQGEGVKDMPPKNRKRGAKSSPPAKRARAPKRGKVVDLPTAGPSELPGLDWSTFRTFEDHEVEEIRLSIGSASNLLIGEDVALGDEIVAEVRGIVTKVGFERKTRGRRQGGDRYMLRRVVLTAVTAKAKPVATKRELEADEKASPGTEA